MQDPSATATPVTEAAASDARTTLDASPENATEALYQAAIGPVNAGYYQGVFRRFEGARRVAPHWNWAAALCTLNWLMFRRLRSAAVVYITLLSGAFLAFGLARLFVPLSAADSWSLLVAAVSLGVLIPGCYGNAFLFAASRKHMAQALVATATLEQACAQLRGHAPTRRSLLALVGVNAALIAAAAAAYWHWPDEGLLALAKPPLATPAPLASAAGPARLAASAPVASAPAPTAVSSSPKYAAAIALLPQGAASTPAPAPAAAASLAPAPMASAPSAPVTAASEPPRTAITPAPTRTARTQEPAQAASQPVSHPAPQSPAPRATPASAKAGPYFVNVGLFAQASNAERTLQKLRDAKLPAVAQSLTGPQGPRTRVRVGPFASQAAAQAAVSKIQALQLDAVIATP